MKGPSFRKDAAGKLEGSAVCMWGPECKGRPDPDGPDIAARCLCSAHAHQLRETAAHIAFQMNAGRHRKRPA